MSETTSSPRRNINRVGDLQFVVSTMEPREQRRGHTLRQGELLLAVLPRAGFIWLLTGGILYSSGIVFYALDHRYPWMHGA